MSAIRREGADISRERRAFLAAAVGLAGMSHHVVAQLQAAQAPVPPAPTPRDYSKLEPIRYPDPDIVALDRRFQRYIVFNAPIRRLHIGTSWAEGTAWNGVGRYLVWSDIPNVANCVGSMTTGTSACSAIRRATATATRSIGKAASSRANMATGAWCVTNPVRSPCWPTNGKANVSTPRMTRWCIPMADLVYRSWLRQHGHYEGQGGLEVKEAVYRIDPKSGKMALVTDELAKPNGLCFSPDTKSSTSQTPASPRRHQGLGRRWSVDRQWET